MRECRAVQMSIFVLYSQHEFGTHLQNLSDLLDEHPEILPLLENDLIDEDCNEVGRIGQSVESIFRYMLLKQMLNQVDQGVNQGVRLLDSIIDSN